jgi:protein associated with RNAse G/E
LIYEDTNYFCVSIKNADVLTSNFGVGRTFYSNIYYPCIWFFIKNEWFNIILGNKNNNYYFYINVASPHIIEDDTIKYIDLDIDYRINNIKTTHYVKLDINEFKKHLETFKYPKHLLDKIQLVCEDIERKIKSNYFNQYIKKEWLK